jgi:PST family polysaccharide transporter
MILTSMGATALAAAKTPDRTPWRTLLAAMSKSGGASLASGLLSALAMKTVAAVAGPVFVALLVTLQQIRQTALVASTGNGQTVLVRAASALDGRQRREFVRTAACIFASATSLVVVGMLAAPQWVIRWAGLPPALASTIRWLAVPLILSSLFVFGSALLSALGRIGDLAVLQILAAAAMAAGAWPAAGSASAGRPQSLAWLLGLSATVGVAAAGLVLLRLRYELKDWFCGPGRMWASAAARSFSSTSFALLASSLTASGVLLAVRGRIISRQGMVVTGQFDAAWGISMNYVTLVLSSLQTCYLPALARARTAAQRNVQISNVLTLATLAAAVLIAAVASLKPHLLTLFYSAEFRPGVEYLRWTLVGDYFKVTSWILSIPILAAAEMKVFLAADFAAYGVFVGAATGLTFWLTAASSAGVAFVLMYAAHLLVCAMYLIRRRKFVPAPMALLAWTAGLTLVVGVSALSWNQT